MLPCLVGVCCTKFILNPRPEELKGKHASLSLDIRSSRCELERFIPLQEMKVLQKEMGQSVKDLRFVVTMVRWATVERDCIVLNRASAIDTAAPYTVSFPIRKSILMRVYI